MSTNSQVVLMQKQIEELQKKGELLVEKEDKVTARKKRQMENIANQQKKQIDTDLKENIEALYKTSLNKINGIGDKTSEKIKIINNNLQNLKFKENEQLKFPINGQKKRKIQPSNKRLKTHHIVF